MTSSTNSHQYPIKSNGMKKVFGVPIRAISIKGSILWPLLFLIFINDMVEDLSSDPSLYADDALLIKALHSSRDVVLVNKDLQIIADWAAQWRVNFNASKTVYMIAKKWVVLNQFRCILMVN